MGGVTGDRENNRYGTNGLISTSIEQHNTVTAKQYRAAFDCLQHGRRDGAERAGELRNLVERWL